MAYSQDSTLIKVGFDINGKTSDFSKIDFSLVVGKHKIKPLMILNGFYLPQNITEQNIGVLFI
jgi:hypothetical protein